MKLRALAPSSKLSRRRDRSRAAHGVRGFQKFFRRLKNRYFGAPVRFDRFVRPVTPCPALETAVVYVAARYPELSFDIEPDPFRQTILVTARLAFRARMELVDGIQKLIGGQAFAIHHEFHRFALEDIPEDYLRSIVMRMARDVDEAQRDYLAKARAA